MKNKLVSIIVPVFNVEKYLKEALESVVNQTYKNIEIICVNDGSTDNSMQILEEYIAKDTRIRILTQQNKGLSAARNTGLKEANGEYIYFLDSDDYFDLEVVEKTVNLFTNEIDIISFNLEKIYEIEQRHEKRVYPDNLKGEHKVSPEIFEIIFEESPRNVFKNSLIKKYNIKYAENLIFEDNSFILNYLSVSDKIYILPESLYRYRIRPNSIMHNRCSQKYIGHRLKNLAYYENFLKVNNLTHRDDIDEFIYKIVARFYMDMKDCDKSTKNRFLICKEAHNIIKNYEINFKSKYLKKHEIFTLKFLKSKYWIFFAVYYKINFIIHKFLRYKHSH